jgi:hypothetical protein
MRHTAAKTRGAATERDEQMGAARYAGLQGIGKVCERSEDERRDHSDAILTLSWPKERAVVKSQASLARAAQTV